MDGGVGSAGASAPGNSADDRYRRQLFRNFLDYNGGSSVSPDSAPSSAAAAAPHRARVEQMLRKGERRLVVDLDALRRFDADLTRTLMRRAPDVLPAFQDALTAYASSVAETIAFGGGDGDAGADPDAAKQAAREREEAASAMADEDQQQYFVGFTGSFGANLVNPRTLKSHHLRSLLCVEGIVTKVSGIHPKVTKSVHYCEKTRETLSRNYTDAIATFGGAAASSFVSVYPTKDASGNPLTTEYGHCVYRDHQTAVLQEMPEQAPAGQLPRSVLVVLDDDLVDRVKPGDRVQVSGVYCALAPQPSPRESGASSGNAFQTLLVANNVKHIARDSAAPTFTAADVRNIRAVAADPSVPEKLARSIAPSIHGHPAIKRAMLLQLMGGMEKSTGDSSLHLRGDIHILLVGDPSTAKSQLLRYVLNVAPLAVSTNGRGASGVGLTAAVVVDQETKERTLEAGAMVLADRGVVCIDEFDKMDVEDRGALHEVMEQQTVSIQKAGVHASLNARCSVLAAANPIYGTYNMQKSVMENIGLPSSLLSRFDLLFIVLDSNDPQRDRMIAEHVLRMHREGTRVASVSTATAGKGVVSIEDFCADDDDSDALATEAEGATPVYSARDALFKSGSGDKVFSLQFLRKYITFARHRVHPALSPEASAALSEAYTEFRSKSVSVTSGTVSRGSVPITARALESLIRLSEARARCRLSNTVSIDDARAAIALMRYTLHGEQSEGLSEAAPAAAPADAQSRARAAETRRKKVQTQVRGALDELFQMRDDVKMEELLGALGVSSGAAGQGPDGCASAAAGAAGDDMDVELGVVQWAPPTAAEVSAALSALSDDNQIAFDDGVAYKLS
eukprot:m51a1_g3216 DNA replication licensing factor MCM3 (850) ;mRNA; f:43082-46050